MTDHQEGASERKGLLAQLCGDDESLYAVLRSYLYYRPQEAVSGKDLAVLIEEAERSGDFRQAIDKVIFEGSQNPHERQRYIERMGDITSRAIGATQETKAATEQAGLADRAASLTRRIEDYRLMLKRADDVLSVATDYYRERLLVAEESLRRVAREDETRRLAHEEQEIEKQEKLDRIARKQERRKMSRSEKRDARKRESSERSAAQDRREKRAADRVDAEAEGRRVDEAEAQAREERQKERSRD